jgi:hypothetical protein
LKFEPFFLAFECGLSRACLGKSLLLRFIIEEGKLETKRRPLFVVRTSGDQSS